MPFPMVFKIRNEVTNQYVTSSLSAVGLSLIATAPQGYQDGAFNNENNYDGQGSEAFGGYYSVDPNTGVAYTLLITAGLYRREVIMDSYLISENITGY